MDPEKTFNHSYKGIFLLIFRRFMYEGLDNQMFTASRAFFPGFQKFPEWRFATPAIHRPCECYKNRSFTPKLLKISRTHTPCEGVNTFLRSLNTYIHTRVPRIFWLFWWPLYPSHTTRGFRFTSPGLVFTTRRLEKTTPGLVKTIWRERRMPPNSRFKNEVMQEETRHILDVLLNIF